MRSRSFTLATLLAIGVGLATAAVRDEPRSGALRHVVSFKFKESATPEQIRAVEEAFGGMLRRILEGVFVIEFWAED